jgi:hypothetical protein
MFTTMALLIGPSVLICLAAEDQVPSERQVQAATSTINLTEEQRHIIKEIVKDLKIQDASGNIQISIGAAAPQNLDLQSFPPEVYQKVPQVRSHNFFVKDNRVIIVSPKDNTMVDVIE